MSVLLKRYGLSTTGNRATWTFSAWIKRSRELSGSEFIFSSNDERTGGTYYSSLFFSGNSLRYYDYHSGSQQKYLVTNRKFRDTNGWYHIVFRNDTTQATASDRFRMYVNGVQETSFSSSSYPSQNDNSGFVNYTGMDNYIGTQTNNLNEHFLGSMSHIHLCDGYSYAPTEFGETDSTTGEWKIKTNPSVSYGTNGFFILKDGNSVTDQSGNSNNFSVGSGTLTKTEDNPSNVFCTMNPLSTGTDVAFSTGNNTIRNDTSTWNSTTGTIAFGNGKYYFEAKRYGGGGTANVGITLSSKFGGNHSDVDTGRIMYSSNGTVYKEGVSDGNNTSAGTFGDGDIIGVSMDTENGVLKFYKNNTLVDTTTNTSLLYTNNEYIPACGTYNGAEFNLNFGNGYFKTTAVSSAGTNASGNGIFEYDVPTGFTALSTKGLNE